MQTIAWVKLRRDGHPELTWEEAGDMVVEFVDRGPYERRALDQLAASADSGRMTPREVDELTDEEYAAMVRYANAEIEELNRAARRR